MVGEVVQQHPKLSHQHFNDHTKSNNKILTILKVIYIKFEKQNKVDRKIPVHLDA